MNIMRIYIDKKLPKSINIENDIKYTRVFKNIYSKDGIYKIYNERILKLENEDGNIEQRSINEIDLLIDHSKIQYKKEIFSLPFPHKMIEITEIEYKKNYKSNVSLIIHYNKNNIIDLFFICNVINNNNLNDIVEYIKLFK